jgi:hypothetical protein
MTDPLVYPVAREIIPFDSPVLVRGGAAWVATVETANAHCVGPSFPGNDRFYLEGQTMRVRMLPDPPKEAAK